MTVLPLTLGDIYQRLERSRDVETVTAARHTGHLPTCQHGHSLPCHWCDWAVVTDDVTRLMANLEDTEVILSVCPSGLGWALAAWSVATASSGVNTAGVRPEALDIMLALREEVTARQHLLLSTITHRSEMGGSLELCVRRIAALKSIVPMADNAFRSMLPRNDRLRRDLTDLLGGIDTSRLQLVCDAEAEQLVGGEIPKLRTANELTALNARRQQSSDRAIIRDLPRGSFEELATAAQLTGVVERIHGVADLIESTPGCITVTIANSGDPYPKEFRRILWAQCSIDWVHTFVDISGAPCWRTEECGPNQLRVPWFVGMVLASEAARGSIPATAQRRHMTTR